MQDGDSREDLPIQLSAEEVADLYEAELAPSISSLSVLEQAALQARLAEISQEFSEIHGREPGPREADQIIAQLFTDWGLEPDPERLRHRIARYAVGKAVRAMADRGYVEIAGPNEIRPLQKLFESDGGDLPGWIKPSFVEHLRRYFLDPRAE